MVRKLEGSSKVFKFDIKAKALSPMHTTDSGTFKFVTAPQFMNACWSIVSTEEGISKDFKEEHSASILMEIYFKESGKLIVSKDEHPEKALSPMYCTLSGTTTSFNALQ